MTRLEAAMLALHLLEYKWVAVDHYNAPVWAYPNEPEWWEEKRVFFAQLGSHVISSIKTSSFPVGKIEILPWLESHNIPIPEVK